MLEVLAVGLVLSADSFSAAIAMGHRPFTERDAFRFAFTSGLSEGLVAMLGALAGGQVIRYFSAVDHWIAFGLLIVVASHMAYEGIKAFFTKKVEDEQLPFHSFVKILIVSLATSLDAFGVGIGIGIANKPLIPFILSISVWAFLMTLFGLHLAKKLSAKFGPVMNILGAIVLGVMAFQMLKI